VSLRKIISGGQTGVDRAALDAALALSFPCGGWCPKGRISEDGTIPDQYPLKEMPTAQYPPRTRKNIAESDGTLIVVAKLPASGRGTRLTIKAAHEAKKPVLVVARKRKKVSHKIVEKILAWCEQHNIRTLNVAGTRGSKDPLIHEKTQELIYAVLRESIGRDKINSL